MNQLLNLLLLSTTTYSQIKKQQQNNYYKSHAYRNADSSTNNTTSPGNTYSETPQVPYMYSNTNQPTYNNSPQQPTQNNTSTLYGSMTNNCPNTGSMTNDTMQTTNINNEQDSIMAPLYNADIAVGMIPSTGPFTLIPLEYDYDALEPYIDEATMRLHHGSHHQNYVNKLNEALARYPEFYNYTLEELLLFPDRLTSDIQTQVRNNAGGHYNHSLMWKLLSPSPQPPNGLFNDAINRQFGSFDNLKTSLKTAANSVFGSGYAWLILNPYGRLQIVTSSNQTTPIPLRAVPLLPIDVLEHAHYLKHQNNRSNYIDDYFNVVDWNKVGKRYVAALESLG